MVVHHRNFAGSQLPDASEVLSCIAVLQNIDSKTPLSWNRSTQEKTLVSVFFFFFFFFLNNQKAVVSMKRVLS